MSHNNAVRPKFSGCGMCGAVSFASAPDALNALDLDAMVKSMHHRGPNGHGTYRKKRTFDYCLPERSSNILSSLDAF